MLLRPRAAVGRHQGVRSTSHLQGTFGSPSRRVRPVRGVAHSHSPGYSQPSRLILRTSALRSSPKFAKGPRPTGELVAYPVQLPAAGTQARLLWHSSNYNTAELDLRRGRSSLTLTIVYGVLVVGGTCLLALAGLELVQRLVPATSRQPHNDVAGFIYAALGVIYAVLLVIAVWEQYQAASETVELEANAVAEIFWLGNRLPEPEGSHIQELARSYAEEVAHKEWPLMEQGQAPLMTQVEETPAGWTLIDDIRANLQEFQPRTAADEQLYAEGLDQIQRLADARRMRLVAAEEGIPGVLWAVLIFGGIATVGFTYLFGLENTWAHRVMVVILAGVIGLVLFTIGAMEHPFSGGARIGTEAFDLILESFETSKLSNLR